MTEHYDQREALYALYAGRAFPDPISPLTSKSRVTAAIKEAVAFARAQAFEDAAAICGALRRTDGKAVSDDWNDATVDCADAIRSFAKGEGDK